MAAEGDSIIGQESVDDLSVVVDITNAEMGIQVEPVQVVMIAD
jgi:hypothetical protein